MKPRTRSTRLAFPNLTGTSLSSGGGDRGVHPRSRLGLRGRSEGHDHPGQARGPGRVRHQPRRGRNEGSAGASVRPDLLHDRRRPNRVRRRGPWSQGALTRDRRNPARRRTTNRSARRRALCPSRLPRGQSPPRVVRYVFAPWPPRLSRPARCAHRDPAREEAGLERARGVLGGGHDVDQGQDLVEVDAPGKLQVAGQRGPRAGAGGPTAAPRS